MIRDATFNDIPTLLVIEQACQSFPWTEAMFQECFDDKHLCYVLCEGDEVIGFIILQPVLDEASLLNIVVHPQQQGQGRGKQLWQYAAARLRDNKIKTVFLEVRKSNHQAIQFYESLGFHKISIRKNYYCGTVGQEDAIIMRLDS